MKKFELQFVSRKMNPSPSDIPAGRAYLYFENLRMEFPESIEIELWDSYSPGDNSYSVVVNGLNSLIEFRTMSIVNVMDEDDFNDEKVCSLFFNHYPNLTS